MAELPVLHASSMLHWVPTGTDPSGWKERPIGSWVAWCDDELRVGPLWNPESLAKALTDRKRCETCAQAELLAVAAAEAERRRHAEASQRLGHIG